MIEWKQLIEQTRHNNSPSKQKDLPFSEEDQQSRWISSTEKLKNQIQNIPDRMGFKIGEVARQLGVRQYVLRYWESEFNGFHPKKSKNGQRIYTKKDMETAFLIKKLLYEDRFSIEGARSALNKLRKQIKHSIENSTESPDEKSIKDQSPKQALKASVPKAIGKENPVESPSNHPSLKSAYKILDQIRQARKSLNL